MKKAIYMIVLLTGVMAMSACSNPTKIENKNLNKEVAKVTQENQQLKEELLQLQQKNQELDEELDKIDPSRNNHKGEEGYSVLTIYGGNIDSYKREFIKEVKILDTLPLEEKLEALAELISKESFNGLEIEISKIGEEDGKKIATIDLKEKENPEDASWSTGYFQGSAGGAITAVSLEETFLQREYDGEWIDGVRFLYEGEAPEFDHIGILGETIDR